MNHRVEKKKRKELWDQTIRWQNEQNRRKDKVSESKRVHAYTDTHNMAEKLRGQPYGSLKMSNSAERDLGLMPASLNLLVCSNKPDSVRSATEWLT